MKKIRKTPKQQGKPKKKQMDLHTKVWWHMYRMLLSYEMKEGPPYYEQFRPKK